jgi:tRNA (cytidine/uridine-2'-O-)-methyltransferase
LQPISSTARPTLRLALYEPDIPQNTGTILRLCACLGVEAHLVGPAGFPSTDRAFRRAGMDYLDQVAIQRHISWTAFNGWRLENGLKLALFSTKAATSYLDHAYTTGEILLFGRESAGVPDDVHQAADVRLLIPMKAGLRSIIWRSPAPWPWAKHCGRRTAFQQARLIPDDIHTPRRGHA